MRACSKRRRDNFDALHLSGLAKAQSGQMGEAYRLIAAALKVNDRAARRLHQFRQCAARAQARWRGAGRARAGACAAARRRRALQLRGNALLSLNRPHGSARELRGGACAPIRASPRRSPTAAPRWPRSAVTEEALTRLRRGAGAGADHAGALYNRGNALLDLGRARAGACRLRSRAGARARAMPRPGTTAAAPCRCSTATRKRSKASARPSRWSRIMPTPIPIARCRCSRSAISRSALPNMNGAGNAAA